VDVIKNNLEILLLSAGIWNKRKSRLIVWFCASPFSLFFGCFDVYFDIILPHTPSFKNDTLPSVFRINISFFFLFTVRPGSSVLLTPVINT